MARVVLGIDADVQGNLSAVEAMEEQLRVVRVAVCIARVRAALKVLTLPETSVRCTWDVSAGDTSAATRRKVTAVFRGTGFWSPDAVRALRGARLLRGAVGAGPHAVERFQALHGLAADGVVGPRTLAALGLS